MASEKQIKTKHLAVLGPKNSFSDIAAEKYFKLQKNPTNQKFSKYFAENFKEIFELVEKSGVFFGLVPLENKIGGKIKETENLLRTKKVHIAKKFKLKIHHSLITLKNAPLIGIKKIISHPQALSQCKKYLKKNFSHAEKKAYVSTTKALEKLIVSKDKSIAVIASEVAAKNPNLKIATKNIEDEKNNITTFVFIKSEKKNKKA